MKANDKDKLYSLFQESKSMMPEVNLESCLMQSIKLAAEKKQQKMHMYYAIALVAALLAIVVVPLICLYIFGLLPTLELNTEIEIFRNMKNGFGSINFQSPFLFIPYVIFVLLIFDLLIRKRIWNKEHSEK